MRTEGEFRDDPGEEARFRRLLTERLPRYAAPARLRAAIAAPAAPGARGWWWGSALSAIATALVFALVVLPLLPGGGPPDPLQPFARAVLSVHTRSLLWGEPRPEAVPAALPRFVEETGIGLAFFQGDDELQLVDAEPLIVEGRRALALSYRDLDGHTVTYVLLSGTGMTMPDRGRVQVDRFRPLLTRLNGFSLFVWKQQDVACFLIADLVSEHDLERFKQVFLKIRRGTGPLPKS